MLVNFPIGLWVFSLVCDLVGLSVAAPDVWFTVALYTMVGGFDRRTGCSGPGIYRLVVLPGRAPATEENRVDAHDDQFERGGVVCGEYRAAHKWPGQHGDAGHSFGDWRVCDCRLGVARRADGARLWRGCRRPRIIAAACCTNNPAP